MNYRAFYAKLFQPVEKVIGPIDRDTIFAILGFDFGGPLNFSTVGRAKKAPVVTYVSCELAVRKEQTPSSHGRFELMCHCDDEVWVRRFVSKIGAMSMETRLDHLHTIDMASVAGRGARLQGAVLERFATKKIRSLSYSILRVHGVTKRELGFAMKEGGEKLFEHLKQRGVYPNMLTKRKSTL